MKILKTYITIIFCLSIFAVTANTHSFVAKKSAEIILATEHSLIAPEGTRYQWYLNNIQIEGATEKELQVTSSGFYKVELTTFKGDVIEKNTIVSLTEAGAIIRIFTIGDSTVQDYTAGYYPRKGWGQVLPTFFNTANVSVINKAVGGTSSKSYYNTFWPAVRDGLQAGDFVFIQFGINDRNSADPARYTPTGGEFESYLTKYVNETKAKGAHPVLVATLRRNSWNADGITVYDSYHDHPVATRTVAKSLGVPLIDLDAKAKVLLESVGKTYSTRLLYNNYVAGEYPNYPNGNTDDVHFQEMGAIEMAKLVTQGIRELSADPNVSKLIPYLKPEYQIAVSVNPLGSDQVTTRTTTYPPGLTITLKTIPKTTSTFQKWNNAAGTQLSTATLTTVTSGTAATSYTAIYAGAVTTCQAAITAPSTAICSGGSVVLTSSTGASYKWFNGTTQVGTAATYTATTAGAYTVEVTNASGCKATSAVKQITVNAAPVATITSPAASFCTGGSVVLTSSAGASYKWFNGTTQVGTASAYTATTAGAYTVEVTNSVGCKATSAVKQITVNAAPVATITSPAASFCTGGSVVLTSSAGASYKWFNGTTQVGTAATYTATTAGAYTVEVTNAAGCKATSAVTQITVNAAPVATITSPAASFCTGGSVVLTASAGASYKWFNGTTQVGTAATYTATAAGAYTVEVTNAGGCKATSAVTQITVNAAPVATITSPAASFCTGGSVTLTASVGASYKWFNGTTQVGTAATHTATTAGAYTVEVTNAGGCKATSAVTQITVNAAPTATITSPAASFCTGGSVVLTSSTGTSYKWFNGTTQVGTAATYTATAAGAYTVEVTNAGGCKATSVVTQITVNAAPTATITSPVASFCTGGSVVLTSSAGASYKWFNGTIQVGTAATYTATAAGAYTVEVTNGAGCKVTSAALTITENNSTAATPTITSPAASFCTGGSVILSSSTGTSYKWFNGTTQVGTAATYTATTAGSYTVEVTNSSGCKATSAVIQISVAATVTWYADADNDGLGDLTNTLNACTKPNGYVATAGDACPADATKTNAGNCGCGSSETACLDCNGTANGTAFLDNCSVCVGGTTGKNACVSTATVNGTSANITVAPQPFDENTIITVENYGMIQSFTIINASGALVETRQGLNTTEISLGESIASGLYTVIITTEQGTYTTRIIKK